MFTKRAKRNPNFSASEVTALLQLVRMHKAVIENKKTDAVNNNKKQQAWVTIAEEFNAQVCSPREPASLRAKYEDLKKNFRKRLAEQRRETFKSNTSSDDDKLFLDLMEPSSNERARAHKRTTKEASVPIKLDDMLDEYAEVKQEPTTLLHAQTTYYRDKNQREKELHELEIKMKEEMHDIDMEIKKAILTEKLLDIEMKQIKI